MNRHSKLAFALFFTTAILCQSQLVSAADKSFLERMRSQVKGDAQQDPSTDQDDARQMTPSTNSKFPKWLQNHLSSKPTDTENKAGDQSKFPWLQSKSDPKEQSYLFDFDHYLKDKTPIGKINLDGPTGYMEIARLAANSDPRAADRIIDYINQTVKKDDISYLEFKTITSGLEHLGMRYAADPKFRDPQLLVFLESFARNKSSMPEVKNYGTKGEHPADELAESAILGLSNAGANIAPYAKNHPDYVKMLMNSKKHSPREFKMPIQGTKPLIKPDSIEQGSSINPDASQQGSSILRPTKSGGAGKLPFENSNRKEVFSGLKELKQFSSGKE